MILILISFILNLARKKQNEIVNQGQKPDEENQNGVQNSKGEPDAENHQTRSSEEEESHHDEDEELIRSNENKSPEMHQLSQIIGNKNI